MLVAKSACHSMSMRCTYCKNLDSVSFSTRVMAANTRMHLATVSSGILAPVGLATMASHVGSLSTTVKNACMSRAADSPTVPVNKDMVSESPNWARRLAM